MALLHSDALGIPLTGVVAAGHILPPTQLQACRVTDSLIGQGCRVGASAAILRSVVGNNTRIGVAAIIEDSLIIGSEGTAGDDDAGGGGGVVVESGVVLRGVVVDVAATIGAGAIITNQVGVKECNRPEQGYSISEGIVCIHAGANVPPGALI